MPHLCTSLCDREITINQIQIPYVQLVLPTNHLDYHFRAPHRHWHKAESTPANNSMIQKKIQTAAPSMGISNAKNHH